MTAPEPGIRAVSQELIEELMGTVVAVDFVLQTLMNLPADALPGEDRTEAIRELLTASACHEVEVVGEDACRAAITLIEKRSSNGWQTTPMPTADFARVAPHRTC